MRAPASTPRVGSSASSTRGAPSSARANSTFCWLPPDSAATLVSADGVLTPSRSICAATTGRSRARRTNPACATSPSASSETFSRTESVSITPSRWRSPGRWMTPGAAHPARPAQSQCAAGDPHPPAGGAHPGERAQERALSVALDPGQADDLAGLRRSARPRGSRRRSGFSTSSTAAAPSPPARLPGKT